MKARNWLFLASFLIMMEGAMDISIYFIQYMWLGLRYVPNVPAQIHRANVLCIVTVVTESACLLWDFWELSSGRTQGGSVS